ncbi:MAG: AzlD domain-containing protein [Oscillospiraceae bacterium]|nr:AzlD domain-containing protein [Oscillospiraceae bacterium]
MEKMSTLRLIVSIAVMALTTYAIRMLPLTLMKKKITNRFLRSFLYYIPYAVLTAMVFPAILSSTASLISGIVGCAAAVIAALAGLQLLPVALIACGSVYVAELLLRLLS